MATVYHCANVLSPRIRGAIKIVDPGQHQGIRARFIREVEALVRLRHHAVIRVLTSGQDVERGLLYMVMELIEGEDLLQILKRGPLPWAEICDSFRQVADGLRHAHLQGIHHRDIKPANVMLQEDGGAVIVDFGIALDQERSRLTRAGMVPGTVSYMAPEVLTGDPRTIEADRADVYSLGVVLYEALLGQRAFPMDNRGGQAAAMIRIIEKKHEIGPLDPGDVAPDRVREVIRRCTELHPLQRPTMGQVVRLLDAARSAPDAIEAMLGPDTVTEDLPDFDPEHSFPFALYRSGSLTSAEEETLVLDLMDNVEEGLRAAIDAELDRLPLDQHLTQPPVEALEPVQWHLDELTENARAITEDEEVGGVFDRQALERQIRGEKRARIRQQSLLWITAFLAVAIFGGFVTALGAIAALIWLWPG
jgi:serine/threonine protein kinase